MRASLLLFVLLLSGCTQPAPPADPEAPAHVHCTDQPHIPTALYLAEGHMLANASGPQGQAPANQGHEAFLSDYAPWASEPLATGIQLEGNVTIDLYIEVTGPNPFSPRPDGTQFYIQFGSDRSFAPGGIRVPQPATSPIGPLHVNASIPLPEGGFTVEAGGRLTLLVTSLLEGPESGAMVQYGGDTPSQVRFASRCSEPREWLLKRNLQFPVLLPTSQGYFTGAVPAQEGVNRLTVGFDLEEGTARLTVMLRQMGGAGAKNDMDMYLISAGNVVYEGASPYANETMVLWPENLDAFLPVGHYEVRIDSYSGTNYSGRLTIQMDETEPHED